MTSLTSDTSVAWSGGKGREGEGGGGENYREGWSKRGREMEGRWEERRGIGG